MEDILSSKKIGRTVCGSEGSVLEYIARKAWDKERKREREKIAGVMHVS